MKNNWPPLAYEAAKDTYETLHLWTQIAGKIKLEKLPWVNHSWHVTLLVTPQGLTTGALPEGDTFFQIDFDLVQHVLLVQCSTGEHRSFALEPMPVAEFYQKLVSVLAELNISVNINKVPNELEHPIPFDQDYEHASYAPEHAAALHQALLRVHEVFALFRSEFLSKCSPVHFFWGSFDLAVSRFSGRTAPEHPGGVPHLPDWVVQEAYSHEVCSCGFWPGSGNVTFAAFYSYIYPAPTGYAQQKVQPEQAYFHPDLQEFVLPYEVVQQSDEPVYTLLQFLQSTYEAAANLARWDRHALEVAQ